MLRQLLWLVVVVWLGWLLRRLFRGLAPAAPAQPRSAPVAKDIGTMVRDRVCNKFLPRGQALRLEEGGEEHFFCSQRCLEAFQAGRVATRT